MKSPVGHELHLTNIYIYIYEEITFFMPSPGLDVGVYIAQVCGSKDRHWDGSHRHRMNVEV